MDKMNKKWLILVALVAIGAVAFFGMKTPEAPTSGGSEGAPLRPEAALPSYDASAPHLLLAAQDVPALQKILRFYSGILSFMSEPDFMEKMEQTYEDMELPEGADPLDQTRKFLAIAGYVDFLDTFLASAEDFALLTTSSDFYVSLFTDEAKYADLKSTAEGPLNAATPWTSDIAGEGTEAFVVKKSLPSFDDPGKLVESEFRVVKRTIPEQGGKVLLQIANSEEALSRSARAWADSTNRAEIVRHLDDDNFTQYLMHAPNYTGGEPRPIFAEIAWHDDGKSLRSEAYVDPAIYGETLTTSGMENESVPMFGEGEPMLLATFDFAYLFSAAFPGVEDPAGFFLSMLQNNTPQATIPPQFEGDIRALLTASRISMGCFVAHDQLLPKSAYLLFEMKDKIILDRYVALAGMMMTPASAEGWETILRLDIDETTTVTVAQNGNTGLLGLGAPENYAHPAPLPAAMKDVPEKGILMSFYFSPDMLLDETSEIGKIFRLAMDEEEELRDLFEKFKFDSISSIRITQTTPERSTMRIEWREK